MAETSLIPTKNHRHFAKILMEHEGVENFLEIDFRKYEDQLTQKQARALIRELAYWMLYRFVGEKGRPLTDPVAYHTIRKEYAWLLEITEWRYGQPAMTRSHADGIAKRLWEAQFEGRTKFAAARFRDRMLQVDRLLPVAENAILEGDLGAIDKFVALARLDMDATGYKAPTKYEFSADAGGELTEADKQSASEAIDDARKFEDQILGEVIEGTFEESSEEE